MAARFGERSWFWEGHVQLSLARHLERQGWAIEAMADTETKATGIDLLAMIGNRSLAVEVKGYPSVAYEHGPKRGQPKPTQPASQARQRFSHALLGMMLLRDKRPDAEIALGLPRFLTYERLLTRTRGSFEMLGFGAYLVDEEGRAALVVPHRPVGPRDGTHNPSASEAFSRLAAELTRSTPTERSSEVTTCREQVLAALARLERRHGRHIFALDEIVQEVQTATTCYSEQTIRTHVVSRMCANAPRHHAVTYSDLERVDRGCYRIRRAAGGQDATPAAPDDEWRGGS